MKKLISMVLVLAMCLTMASSALAYTPGQPMSDAFANAFNNGKLILADMTLKLDFDSDALGLSGEEAAMAKGIFDLLANTTLTLGAGKTDDGLRVAIGADVANAEKTNNVSVDALLDVSFDGLALQSDVIPGKMVTIGWSTLLQLAGLSVEEAEAILSLKDVDFEALAAEMLPEMLQAAEELGAIIAPYAVTVVDFVAGLPMETRENLNEEDYPPTALEVAVLFTLKDVGTLVNQLADQLEQDDALKGMINEVLAESGEDMTADDMIAVMRQFAAEELTNEDTPIIIYVGMNEAGVPMYIETQIIHEPSGENIYAGLFLYETEPACGVFEFVMGLFDGNDDMLMNLYMGGTLTGDPNDPYVAQIEGEAFMNEGDTNLLNAVLSASSVAQLIEGQEGYLTEMSYSMFVNDGVDEVSVVAAMKTAQAATAAGGEKTAVEETVDTYVNGMQMSVTSVGGMTIDPTADGGLTGMYTFSESMPATGINECGIDVRFYTEDIDPAADAALTVLALENASSEDLDALVNDATGVLMSKAMGLLSVIPADLLMMIMAE